MIDPDLIRQGVTYRGRKGTPDRHALRVYESYAGGPWTVRYSYQQHSTFPIHEATTSLEKFARWAKEKR